MRTDRKSRRPDKAPFLTGTTLAVALFLSGNVAGGVPVTVVADVGLPTQLMTTINTQIQQLNMIAERGAEIQREVERVRNLATQASSLISGLTSITMQDPKTRSLDYGMQRCEPDFSGFSLSDAFALLMPSLSSSVPEQQRTICKQIVRLKNKRHNENVELLGKLKTRMTEMETSSGNFRSAGTSGAQLSNLGEQGQILNKLMGDIQYSQAITKVYENTISSLEDDSKYLAEEALSGKKKGLGESLLATGAQTAALCGGLLAAKSDDSDFDCVP
jgi:hypothetical protein